MSIGSLRHRLVKRLPWNAGPGRERGAYNIARTRPAMLAGGDVHLSRQLTGARRRSELACRGEPMLFCGNRPVLATGGASLIGSHLTVALLDRGATVRIVDDLSPGRMDNIHPVLREPGVPRIAMQGTETLFDPPGGQRGRGRADPPGRGKAHDRLVSLHQAPGTGLPGLSVDVDGEAKRSGNGGRRQRLRLRGRAASVAARLHHLREVLWGSSLLAAVASGEGIRQ
jgi:hypothetical protein